jgi:sec-independent protein translocase protein TatC
MDLATDIGVFVATILTSPYALYHVYGFLKPAISKSERRLFWFLIPVMVILFFIGFAYGAVTLYIAFRALAALNSTLGISNIWNISQFLAELVVTAALLGLLFEFPIILTFLIRIKLLPVEYVIAKRRHAYVLIFVFVSLLPPTDGVSLIMTALPLIGIYEVTIFINRAYKRNLLTTN